MEFKTLAIALITVIVLIIIIILAINISSVLEAQASNATAILRF